MKAVLYFPGHSLSLESKWRIIELSYANVVKLSLYYLMLISRNGMLYQCLHRKLTLKWYTFSVSFRIYDTID